MAGDNHETIPFAGHPVDQIFPAAVTRAVRHYTDFSERDPPDNSKEFTGFHTACKAALGHISALLKLEKLCGRESVKKSSGDDIETLLRETRQILLNTERTDDDN